jgi:predicted secreted protein
MALRRALFALPLIAVSAAGRAQAPETKLRLSEIGVVRRLPDEIVATLRVESRAANAAAAQASVNRSIAGALERARSIASVRATTGRASAYRQERQNAAPEWLAAQTLTLRSGEADALLGLVGQLQAQGLAISDLAWQLSDGLMRETRDEATREALRRLRARADLVARELGLRVVALREIVLDGAEPARPMARSMAMAAPAAAPPAVSTPDEIPVQVTASAEVALAP